MTQPTLLPRRRVGPILTLTWLALVGVAILCGTGGGPEQLRAQSPAALVFDGVTVVDVEHGRLLRDQRVVIVGNRIRSMGSTRTTRVPAGAQIVAAQGKYLIPGLWDMHVHSNNEFDGDYPVALANGLTGVRDAGAPAGSDPSLDTLLQWRREILAGTRPGPPRLLACGVQIRQNDRPGFTTYMPGGGSNFDQLTKLTTADTADARHLVDSLKAAGADCIKHYSMSREFYFVIAAEARRVGIPLGGHLANDNGFANKSVIPKNGVSDGLFPWVTAIEASDSGTSIEDHIQTAGGLDSLCVFRQTASVARCQPVAERFRRNGTWLVPTLTQGWAWLHPLISHGPSAGLMKHLCNRILTFQAGRTIQHGNWLRGPTNVTDQACLPLRLYPPPDSVLSPDMHLPPHDSGTLYIIHRVGLPILAGTDRGGDNGWSGFPLHLELALYVAEGLTPLEALQSATLNPAKAFHLTDSLGTVAPGKLADLVLLDANPLEDITNTTTIRAVVANGRYYDRAALDQLLAKAQQHRN